MPFNGNSESKKQAKKNAAYSALYFIKNTINKTNECNPAYMQFRFLINSTGDDHEFKLYIMDKFEDAVYTSGTIFPGNKKLRYECRYIKIKNILWLY